MEVDNRVRIKGHGSQHQPGSGRGFSFNILGNQYTIGGNVNLQMISIPDSDDDSTAMTTIPIMLPDVSNRKQ